LKEKNGLFYADSLRIAGKVVREGMGQATGLKDTETLDLIITNALIVDWSGIYKVSSHMATLTSHTDINRKRPTSESTTATSPVLEREAILM
jgi:hypothetical protein